MYTGKGGTGKTVTSCSTAIKLADKNYSTLIVSSDPAHTLNDAFKLPNHITIVDDTMEIVPHLHALQVDPISEMNKEYGNILSYMASIFSSRGIDETLAYEIAMMPGMTQLFSLLKVEEVTRTRSYDIIVLDMPASGEALRYLYFPKLISRISRKISGLMGAFSGFAQIFQTFSGISLPDKMLRYEGELFERLNRLSDIIRDNSITTLRLVANPDSFSIENAKRAFMSASLYGINVDLAIINKILPSITVGDSSNGYYAGWTKFQYAKVQEAKTNFYPLPVKEVPLHSSELAGIEMLRVNANLMFADDEDPSNIFYTGRPFSIIQETSKKLRIAVKVPFTKKQDFDIKRLGGEVIIKVKSPTGYLVNVIPLPTITFDMKMVSAKLDNYILNILFEKVF